MMLSTPGLSGYYCMRHSRTRRVLVEPLWFSMLLMAEFEWEYQIWLDLSEWKCCWRSWSQFIERLIAGTQRAPGTTDVVPRRRWQRCVPASLRLRYLNHPKWWIRWPFDRLSGEIFRISTLLLLFSQLAHAWSVSYFSGDYPGRRARA